MAGPSYHGRTHLPGGTDPIPGLTSTGGPGLEDVILSQSSVGLWKLNESSGDTALDSSGNGNHMTVPSGYIAPTWGQLTGPPGTQSALWVMEPPNSNAGSRLNVSLGALTDDFSAGAWVRFPNLSFSKELIGQGIFVATNSWSLWLDGNDDKFQVAMGTTGDALVANNASVADTWYLAGFTRESGTATLYVNGLSQTGTSSASPGTSNASAWLGNCGGATDATHGSNAILSWAFITDTPISGAEWLEIHEAGQTGGALEAGLVWTSDGAGGAFWQPSQIEIEY